MNGLQARSIVEALVHSDLPEPELALGFGDVLASWAYSAGPRPKAAVQAAAIAAQLAPDRKTTSRIMATEMTLVGAGHDARSGQRLRPLHERLRFLGFETATWLPGQDRNLPHWSVRIPGTSHSRLGLVAARRIWDTASQVAEQFQVPEPYRISMARWLCVQHARLRFFEHKVDWARAKVLLADYDRGLPASPVVVAARRHGVSTFTLLHGDPNPVGYVPFSAENVLCWSAHQERVLRKWAGDTPRFHVVGTHWRPAQRGPRMSGCPTKQALVVQSGTASLSTFLNEHRELLTTLQRSGFEVRVRPHAMSWGRPKQSTVTVHLSQGSLTEDLEWADWVFSDGSSVALDAVAAGCAVAVPIQTRVPLASLEDVATVPDPTIPTPDWHRLGSAGDGWPYAAVGNNSLTLTTSLLAGAS